MNIVLLSFFLNDASVTLRITNSRLQFVTSSDFRIHVTCEHKKAGEDSDPQQSCRLSHPSGAATQSLPWLSNRQIHGANI
jgi:hypothetical protein